MPLGKERVLNHWNHKPGTSCHLKNLGFRLSHRLLNIPMLMFSLPPHTYLFSDIGNQMIHSVPSTLPDIAKMECALFPNPNRHAAARALPNDEIRLETRQNTFNWHPKKKFGGTHYYKQYIQATKQTLPDKINLLPKQ